MCKIETLQIQPLHDGADEKQLMELQPLENSDRKAFKTWGDKASSDHPVEQHLGVVQLDGTTLLYGNIEREWAESRSRALPKPYSPGLFQSAFDHAKQSWRNVGNGTASTLDEAEAMAMLVGGTALAIYGARFLKPAAGVFEHMPKVNMPWQTNWWKNAMTGGLNAEASAVRAGAEMNAARATAGSFDEVKLLTHQPRESAVQKSVLDLGPGKTFEGNEIPAVLRPTLSAAKFSYRQFAAKAGAAYADDVVQIQGLPREWIASKGQGVKEIVQDVINARAALTGERKDLADLGKELARINKNNPHLKETIDWGGSRVRAYAPGELDEIASKAMFKHVPPIGQLLKTQGKLTDEQLDAAFAYQKTLAPDAPRRLLGEILVDRKLVSQTDVDNAFGMQNALKRHLNDVYEGLKKKGLLD